MKEKSKMAQLMEYAGNYRYLTYSSYVLSAISALVALTPFWCIWKILQEVISVAPNYNEAQNISHYGWDGSWACRNRHVFVHCVAVVLTSACIPRAA